MSKQTIAVDVDDVLAISVPAFLEFSNKRWGTNLKIEDFDEHWAAMWKIDQETLRERVAILDEERIAKDYDIIEDAEHVLRRLKKKYKLVITTARRIEMEMDTTDWIAKYLPDIFEEVHYAGIWDALKKDAHLATKAALCKQIGADYLIDDQPKHCLAAAEAGIECLLFGDYPWNSRIELPKGVARAHNWHDVAEYFDV